MKRLLVAAAFCLSFSALAQDSSRVFEATGSNGRPAKLRIFQTPCEHPKILALLAEHGLDKPEELAQLHRAVLTWDGADYASCWMLYQGHVISIDEEGSPFQPIPQDKFVSDTI